MASQSNNPWQPSAARQYKPQLVAPQNLPVDYSGFIAIIFGVLGAIFRYKVCSWLAIIFCAQSLANMRNMENDLKKISMAMMERNSEENVASDLYYLWFGIMGLVTNYMGLGPRSSTKS